MFESNAKTIFLAKINDEVVGFITIGKNDDEDAVPDAPAKEKPEPST